MRILESSRSGHPRLSIKLLPFTSPAHRRSSLFRHAFLLCLIVAWRARACARGSAAAVCRDSATRRPTSEPPAVAAPGRKTSASRSRSCRSYCGTVPAAITRANMPAG